MDDMVMSHLATSLVAALACGSGTGFVVRLMITRTLEELTGIKRMILEHDRKITELTTRANTPMQPNRRSEGSCGH